MDEKEDTTIYKVVLNHEEQYSIWPADKENALGWKDAGKNGSKAAVNQLTHVLAIELGPHGIRVNAISPGLVLDDVLREGDDHASEYVRLMLRGTPLRRTGSPADIAPAVVFLASDRSGWTTGAILEISGGSHTGRPHVPLSRGLR